MEDKKKSASPAGQNFKPASVFDMKKPASSPALSKTGKKDVRVCIYDVYTYVCVCVHNMKKPASGAALTKACKRCSCLHVCMICMCVCVA